VEKVDEVNETFGLTLLELLVVLLIISVLVALGAPNMSHLVAQQRSTASLNQVIGAVAFARNSAISLGVPTTLCPSSNQLSSGAGQDNPSARVGCGPRNTWHQGSIIFQDLNTNGQLDTNETLLRRLPGWSHDATLAWRAFRARAYLQFTRRGFTNWQNGSFVYCPGNGNLRYARRLVLNRAGRSYRAYDRNGDRIDEGSRNTGLRC
jgi:type IV fimbrial biogenesis protein FimT